MKRSHILMVWVGILVVICLPLAYSATNYITTFSNNEHNISMVQAVNNIQRTIIHPFAYSNSYDIRYNSTLHLVSPPLSTTNKNFYFPFDNDTTTDISPYGISNMTINYGEISSNAGITNRSFILGASSAVGGSFVPLYNLSNLGTGNFTIAAWVKATTWSSQMKVFSKYPTTEAVNNIGLLYDSTATKLTLVNAYGGDIPYGYCFSSITPSTNTWYHMMIIRNGTSSNGVNETGLYINGVFQCAVNNSWNYVGGYPAFGFDDDNSRKFYGYVDEFFFTNQSLNPTEVYQSYYKDPTLTIGGYLVNVSNSSTGEYKNIINKILADGCVCVDCSISGGNCYIKNSYNLTGGYVDASIINISYSYGIDNCSNSLGIPSNATALNVSFRNQDNQLISVPYSANFPFSFNSTSSQYNYSFSSTGNYFGICIYPSWSVLYTDALISWSNNSIEYTYQTQDTILDNSTDALSLYTTPGVSTILYTVLDVDGNPVSNAQIAVLQLDVGTGNYVTTELLTTDVQGEAVGNAVLITTFYRFIVSYNGQVRLIDPSVGGVKFTTNTRTFTINLAESSYTTQYNTLWNVQSTLTFNNDTGYFSYTYADPTGVMHMGCLKVTQSNLSGERVVSDTCVTSTAATITSYIGSENNGGNTFTATGYLKFDNVFVDKILTKVFANVFNFLKKDTSGITLFISFIVVLGMALLGLPNPVTSIVFGVLGLMTVFILQIVSLTASVVVGLAIFGLILIYRARAA